MAGDTGHSHPWVLAASPRHPPSSPEGAAAGAQGSSAAAGPRTPADAQPGPGSAGSRRRAAGMEPQVGARSWQDPVGWGCQASVPGTPGHCCRPTFCSESCERRASASSCTRPISSSRSPSPATRVSWDSRTCSNCSGGTDVSQGGCAHTRAADLGHGHPAHPSPPGLCHDPPRPTQTKLPLQTVMVGMVRGSGSPVSHTFSLSLAVTEGSWPSCWLSCSPSSFSMRLSHSARSSGAVPRRDEASRVCPSRCAVSALLWPTMRYRILSDSIFSCVSWASSPVAA